MNKMIVPSEDSITMEQLMSLIQFERNEAERKRVLIKNSAKLFGKTPTETDIERAGHENDMLAEAYYILLNKMAKRALQGSFLKEDAEHLKLIEVNEVTKEVKEVTPAPKMGPVLPKMTTVEAEKEKKEILTNYEIDESIYEAARLAENKTGSRHWEIARSKVEHFYRDQLVTGFTNRDVDAFIRETVRKVQEIKQKALEQDIGIERDVNPITDPTIVQKVQFVKNGKFNIAILTGNKKHSTEDRVKLQAIQLTTKGDKKQAVQLLRAFYTEKNWDDFTAEEFIKVLMNQDPHKELYTAIKGILQYNKTHKGDAKEGIKLCRNIVGTYLGNKFTFPKQGVKIAPEQEKWNETIDRMINKELNKLK